MKSHLSRVSLELWKFIIPVEVLFAILRTLRVCRLEKPHSSAAANENRELCPCCTAVPLFPAPDLQCTPSEVEVHRGAARAPAAAALGSAADDRPLLWLVPGKESLHPRLPTVPHSTALNHWKNRLLPPGGFFAVSCLGIRQLRMEKWAFLLQQELCQ